MRRFLLLAGLLYWLVWFGYGVVVLELRARWTELRGEQVVREIPYWQ